MANPVSVKKLPASLTKEQGSTVTYSGYGMVENYEDHPELRGLQAIAVYDKMRKSDPEIGAVYKSVTLPLRNTEWALAHDGVNPAVRRFVEYNLGLTPTLRTAGRNARNNIRFDDFLRHALISVAVGFMPMEKVYAPVAPPKDISGLPPIVADLAKLSPRMPRSIVQINVNRNGELVSIAQHVNMAAGILGNTTNGFLDQVTIDADSLVMFVNDQEGANFMGQSILRSSWKHWFMKDQLLRLSAMIVERNGMGIPKVTFPEDGSQRRALQVAADMRAGDRAGIALPQGYTAELMGVSGSTTDPLPLINYHDQAIGRGSLAMFLNLGHDNGARSLGETFVDFFTASLNGVAGWLEETITEQIIRPLVALNFGDDEPYPVLIADEITPNGSLSAESLATLVRYGALTPDKGLEDDTRRRWGLPKLAADAAHEAEDVGPLPDLPDPSDVDPAAIGRPADTRVGQKQTLSAGVDWDRVNERANDLVRRIRERSESETAK